MLRATTLLLLFVLLLGALLGTFGTPAFDLALARAASAGRADAGFWQGVTMLGGGEMRAAAGLLAAAFLWLRKRGRDALILLSVALIQTGTNSALKILFHRARPDLYPHLDRVWDQSYPSGHAAQSAALYLLIALLIDRRLLWIAAPLVLLIGASRVILGVHWPTDVLGGWLEGAGFALLGLHLANSSSPRRGEATREASG